MRTVTATEASRSFAALLDEVEAGETVVVTRGGRRIAAIGPASTGNGLEFLRLMEDAVPDEDFASDVSTAREVATLEGPAWPAD
jgi:prevent-host-death family protein